MFRLHTLYQPGEVYEKALVLVHLQNPAVVHDVTLWCRLPEGVE